MKNKASKGVSISVILMLKMLRMKKDSEEKKEEKEQTSAYKVRDRPKAIAFFMGQS